MTNRITPCDERNGGPRPVAEILEELLAQCEAQFPGVNVVVVETATAA